MKKRKLTIGDIHGSLKALVQVLERCNYDPQYDELIFLGDYVDGWTESAEVIDFLIRLKEVNKDIIFVRGNHDVMFEDWYIRDVEHLVWRMNGGVTTIKSYMNAGLIGDKDHARFLVDMVNFYIDEDNNLFIHGGWDYKSGDFPVSALYPVNAGVGAKECHWDRSLLAGARSGHKSKQGLNALKQFKEVFIGHTATESHLPENYCNLWNIDSGCGWFGKLTIMDVETKEYWQSDYSKDLYPDAKGR